MNVKSSAVSMARRYVSPALDAAGVFDRRLTTLLDHPDRLLVVMYHRVIDDTSLDPFGLGMCVTRDNFVSQLDWFGQEMRPISLIDAVQTLAAGKTLPPRSIAITFDDGYLDNLQIAAPLLRARGIPATFYVATGGMAEGSALWWDRAIRALADTPLQGIALPEIGLPQALPLLGSDRLQTVQLVLDALWRLPPAELAERLDDTVARLMDVRGGVAPSPLASDNGAPRMTAEQVAELHALGFAIGGHTINHVDMRQLDDGRIRAELDASRTILQDICGGPIRSFAFPNGCHNAALQVAVRAAGFDHAVSTDRGINCATGGRGLRRFALYRVGMPDSGLADFKRALCSAPVMSGDSAGPA